MVAELKHFCLSVGYHHSLLVVVTSCNMANLVEFYRHCRPFIYVCTLVTSKQILIIKHWS